MTAADMLAAAGEANTKEGRARFHKRFRSKEEFDNWYNQQSMARGGTPMVAVPVAFYQNGGATDGIAYPQQPTDAYMFEGASWSPSYKQLGGIAYPQQPTSDYFFSGSPWMPHYNGGGPTDPPQGIPYLTDVDQYMQADARMEKNPFNGFMGFMRAKGNEHPLAKQFIEDLNIKTALSKRNKKDAYFNDETDRQIQYNQWLKDNRENPNFGPGYKLGGQPCYNCGGSYMEDGGQYGGSPSPLGYGQMPPVMSFGGLSKKEKNNFVKQVVDGYVKAMGGSPSTKNKTFDTTQDYVQANKDNINGVLRNNFITAAGKEVMGDAIENFDTLKQAGMAAYGQEMDWSSMINPQAQENYNMYNDMYNQGMADTKAGFKTGMNAVGNYVKSVGQSIAANKAAAMAYGGLPQAKFGDPIGPDAGNLFAKGKPFMPAPTSANNAGLNEAQILRQKIEQQYPINQAGNQGNADMMAYLQQILGNQQGVNYGPNSFTFNPAYGDPFDYRGRNQYGKFRLRSYGPGIYNTGQGSNMFFSGAPQAGFQGGNLTPEQLKQYQAMLPAGMKMDYKQKNRMFGLGPKSIEWSLRTGLPAENAPAQVQLQDKAQAQQEEKKPGFFEKRKQGKEAEKKADAASKEEDKKAYEDFLKRSMTPNASEDDVVIPGGPQRSPSNLGIPATPSGMASKPSPLPRFPLAPGFENVDTTPPEPINPSDPRQYAKDFNIFNTLSPGFGPGYSDGSQQTLTLNPRDRQSTGNVMQPFSQPGGVNASVPAYQPRPSISPVENTPTGPVMEPLNQPGGLAYGGYPMMYMGGYNMYADGGQADDEYTYMTDEEIAQFMANGGTIEYID